MPALKFGVEIPQTMGWPKLKEMAQGVERLGYDSIWLRDHPTVAKASVSVNNYIERGELKFPGQEMSCLPGLAALAAVTSRVTLGPDIYVVPLRHPLDVANQTATIDQISGGRFILHGAIGALTGRWDPFALKSTLKERGEMLEESLAIIKALWTHDEPVSFKGKYYSVENARIGTRVVQQPHPPIWLGVGKTFKRVARLATGFTVTGSMWGGAVEDFGNAVRKVRDEATRIGRDPSEITAAMRFAFAIGKDDAAAKKRAREQWAKLRGHEEPWHTAWAGNADTLAKVIKPYIEAGASHILLWPIPYSAADESLRDLELFAREVFPRLKK